MKKSLKNIILLTALALSLVACTGNDTDVDTDYTDWTQKVDRISDNNKVIYEVNLRNFSQEGTIAALTAELDRLSTLGVDIVWLMPIHPTGLEPEGTLGSPYAVADYRGIDAIYGTHADFKTLVEKAHSLNMEIYMDWVANHTAKNHAWVQDHVMYYAAKSGKRPYSPDNYPDVYQLDFDNADLRAAMIEEMKYWVSEFDIDGFRCDYASNVPTSFWQQAKAEVNKVKEIAWFAEADASYLMTAFEMDYAWGFNDKLNTFGETKDVKQLRADCSEFFYNEAYQNKQKMVYLTNHDLNADHGTEFGRYGQAVYPLTVLEFTIYDTPLIYNGQEIGYNKQMGLFTYNKINWKEVNEDMEKLIRQMCRLKRTSPALASGAARGDLYNFATDQNDCIYAYMRTVGDSHVVVLLNFAAKQVNFKLLGGVPNGIFLNYLTGEEVELAYEEEFVLPANGYAVYVKN